MILPQKFFDIYNTTVSDFITNNFGVPCKVIYGNSNTECPNCIINPVIRTSTNTFKSGGPQPFANSVCPYCNGAGYILAQQPSDNIMLRVYFERKDFIRVDDVPINAENSTIQVIGFITDMPKLQQCAEIVVNTNVGNYGQYRYNLAGEVLPWGLGPIKKFCLANFMRNQ